MMETLLTNFHFLRPEWFWALVPAILLYALFRAGRTSGSNWERSIDPDLLPFLLDDPGGKRSRNPLFLILLAWIVATIALAGPVWRKTPQPVHEREDALVVIFDLTGSMYAQDVSPNRLVRARRKLLDLMDMRTEGVTGLIVFAGDAHTVSPLTDDAQTIAEMIPAITPEIMPAPGSQLAPALELAVQLFQDAGVASGRILILTDEIRDIATAQQVAREHRYSYPVSVMAVGTPEGAPIPTPDDTGYVKNSSGVMVIPSVDMGRLADFAGNAGGRFARMTLGDSDLDYLLAEEPMIDREAFRELERDFDIWIEEGPWLLLLLLPLAALAFRRGWVWSIALVLLLPPQPAEASWWDDLWLTRDQQAARALEAGDAERAAELFNSPEWKGAAEYRSDDFENAAEAFRGIESSDGQYNLGNSLARQQRFEDAIAAYDRALAMDPGNEDAAFNKQLLEALMQQQEQQQNDEGDEQEQDPQNGDQQQDESGSENDQESNAQESEEDQQQESQQAQDQEGQQDEQEQDARRLAEQDAEPLDEEEQQALEQWLRRVPDDPGGLLRRKFKQQHEERDRMRVTTDENGTADW